MKHWRFVSLVAFAAAAYGQPLRSLKAVAIPEPADLSTFVRDREALIVLGKAFFWDMQVGSDGRTACATCHFHAGADHRAQNQIVDPNNPFPINLRLDLGMFPLRRLSDPGNRGSVVLQDTEMRVGSAGLFRRIFEDILLGEAAEIGRDGLDRPEFIAAGLQVRRVTARNTPTVINAVFHVQNFWDGRANRIFDGFTPSGTTDDAPGVLVSRDGVLERQKVQLDRSSLASQAVGPAMDHTEMSYAGRTWPALGRKLLSVPPLALQRVAPDDSVLGPLARVDGQGLQDRFTYSSLIAAAFQPAYWESAQLVDQAGNTLLGRAGTPEGRSEFTQAEYNFPLFWGLALQAYQSTLVSNDSPFDRFMDGDAGALSSQEQEGMQLFQNAGRCTVCHGGAEFTAASFSAIGTNRANRAFQRTGVRPAAEDLGRGNGVFKSSSLRNIEFTGPFFHNGGQATLEQVVEFYVRGGDFGPNNNSIRAFTAGLAQQLALVAFMKALTDERVRYERAPFDHPELCVPAGHREAEPGLLMAGESVRYPSSAAENWVAIPAVGAGGNQVPLQTFEELLVGIGGDGSRAHTLTESCAISQP